MKNAPQEFTGLGSALIQTRQPELNSVFRFVDGLNPPYGIEQKAYFNSCWTGASVLRCLCSRPMVQSFTPLPLLRALVSPPLLLGRVPSGSWTLCKACAIAYSVACRRFKNNYSTNVVSFFLTVPGPQD